MELTPAGRGVPAGAQLLPPFASQWKDEQAVADFTVGVEEEYQLVCAESGTCRATRSAARQRDGRSTQSALAASPSRCKATSPRALLWALEAIADGSYADVPLDEYESLDADDTSVFDVLLRGGTMVVPGLEPYRANVGIEFPVPFRRENGEVASIGDLGGYTASEEVDVGGLFLHPRAEALRGNAGS